MTEVERKISGFVVKGAWVDIVAHGERISQALRDTDTTGEAYQDWEEWRPKLDERIHEEVSEKTADKASISKGKGEEEGEDATGDLQTAGEKLEESYETLEEGEKEAIEKAQDSLAHAKRAADTAGRKAVRTIEDTVYQGVMSKFSPYYFDNTIISANLSRKSGPLSDEEVFVFEINVNDDELKSRVDDLLADYNGIDRWHVDTPKDTTSQEEAEGNDISSDE